ncbi:MAG: phage portal protein [Clostridiales bacterium]|jgi:SPP1 family phage portal protein|nr:phage portal protein [Clostridiales bacterium]
MRDKNKREHDEEVMKLTENTLAAWRGSVKRREMEDARQYYLARNMGIRRKRRAYRDDNGDMAMNDTLSNARIASAFVRVSVEQKKNYGFARPFLLETTGHSGEDLNFYNDAWNRFLDGGARAAIERIAGNAILYGIGWGVPYIEAGELRLLSVCPEKVYPVWNDAEHTSLEFVVREYSSERFGEEGVHKVEFWDADTAAFFVWENGLSPDVGKEMELGIEGCAGHISVGGERIGWGVTPFAAFKGNDDELPVLSVSRSYIDEYDALISKAADTLEDDMDAVLLLKGVSPDMGSLRETRERIKNSGIAAVDTDGDARYIKNNPDILAARQYLDLLSKDIKQFNAIIDTMDAKFGTNNSGEALKMMYQDLDIYLNGLESKFREFMRGLKWFFDRWLQMKKGGFERWREFGVNVTLDRDMMVNESSLIENVVRLNGLVSQETLDGYNPAVISHKTERARRKKERENGGDNVGY